MKLIPALLTLCALVLPRALPAETFEGKVSMNLTSSSSKGGSQAMTMSIKDGFLRTDVSTSRGAAAMIMDFKNQQMLVLMAQQRMYMVQPIPQPGSTGQPGMPQAPAAPASAPKETLVDSGAKETILGYVCTKYTVTGAKGTSEVWATDQLGTFAGIFRGRAPGRQAPGAGGLGVGPEGQGLLSHARRDHHERLRELPARGHLGREDEPPRLPLRPPGGLAEA